MADGGDNEPDYSDTVRRQVILTVRCAVDVPVHMDEDAVQFLIEEHSCKSDFIMSLAEQIAYDDEKGTCNVCVYADAKLVPVSEEVKSPWLDNLPESASALFGDEETPPADNTEEDLEEEEEDDEDAEDVEEEPEP